MAPDPRREAQRRANQIRAFRREVEALRDEGALPLSESQDAAIAAHHDRVLARLREHFDVDWSEGADQLSRGLQLASFFGGVAMVAALTTLVARVWGSLALPAQLTLVTLFPLLALAGVQVAAERERTRYVASLVALVGCGTAWVALIMTPRVLDLPFSPLLLWPGVCFGTAVAMSYGFRLVWAISLAAGVLALAAVFFASGGVPWTMAVQRLEPVAGSAFALVLLARRLGGAGPGFDRVARWTGWTLGLGALLMLASVRGASLLSFAPATALYIYQALMPAISVGVIAVSLRRDDRASANLASGFLAAFLLIRYVDWFWERLPLWGFFLGLAAFALGVIAWLRRRRARLEAA